MTGRTILIFALLAAAAMAVFFAISIDADVYAPGASHVSNREIRPIRHILPHRFRHELTPTRILRKTYSIIAFAIVGLFAAPVLPARRRLLLDALVVALFSTAIEIAQKMVGSEESLASNFFDIGCGAIGGLLGALVWQRIEPLVRRRGAR